MNMEHYYEAAGTSRQAFHEWHQRQTRSKTLRSSEEVVVQLARQVRQQFLPGAGARVVYHFIKKHPEEVKTPLRGCGKHRFERICLSNGLGIVAKRHIPKTTQCGNFKFPNRIEGLEIKDINRIWVSDITYLFGPEGKLLGYATSMLDIYSRRLLGLTFSNTMTAEHTAIPVLNQALVIRAQASFNDLIFHSDGGKQYLHKTFLKTLGQIQAQSSMAENCLENGFAEAFNDTLKHHSLNEFRLDSFEQLKKLEPLILKTYNQFKPHSGLSGMTPIAFEQQLLSIPTCQRTTLRIKKIK